MKYTIYKNDVGQLMAMEGHCEFDGVVAQAIDYDAVRNTLLLTGETQPETPHEHYWFNLGHQSNKIAKENNVLRAENARLRYALEFTLQAAEQLYKPEKPLWNNLDPTFYHTLTWEGDLELIEKTKKAREALRGDITPNEGES
jgi:ABC-type uncharacterized transport system substrate-binding protein